MAGWLWFAGLIFFSPFMLGMMPARSHAASVPVAAPVVVAEILAELPHDDSLFTQGLFFHLGTFYESAGLYGQSRLLRSEPATATPLTVHWLAPYLFGEGADLCGEDIVQLTWKNGIAFRYKPETLQQLGEFRYPGEGWGIACDGAQWVMSDGSATLRFRDPETFAPVRELMVTDGGRPVAHLNELEWIDGFLLANVWQSARIAVIDPDSGRVLLWLDLSEAVRRSGRSGERWVLNGIAWDAEGRRLYITGKGWHRIYQVEWPGVPGVSGD